MDLEVGQTASRELTVTAETVRKYAEVTGDYNPLHFDEEFAQKTRFGGLIASDKIRIVDGGARSLKKTPLMPEPAIRCQ